MKLSKKLFTHSLLVALLATSAQAGWERTFNFDQDHIDFPPEGFVVETPATGHPVMIVETDEEAPSKSHVLTMRGAQSFGVNVIFALAWFSEVEDGKISVAVKHGPEGEKMQTLGLTWRYLSNEENCTIEWDTKKSRIAIVATVKGKKPKVLAREKASLPAAEWATLSVAFNGSHAICYINDKEVLRSDHLPILKAGKVGVIINSEAPTSFDNFKIQSED